VKVLLVHNRYQISGGEDSVVAQELAMLNASGMNVELFEVVIIGGLTELSFELTFLTIPYYFLWGLVLALEASTRKRYRTALHAADATIATLESLQPA
jgi:hypothetical protein